MLGVDCEHVPQLVYLRMSNGNIGYQYQCSQCAQKLSQWVAYAKLTAQERGAALARNEWSFWESGLFDQLMDVLGDWWTHYNAYLKTAAWRERSRQTIEAAGGVCERCHRARATQTHHLTYVNVGHEYPSDLQALCKPCHDAVTADSRGAR